VPDVFFSPLGEGENDGSAALLESKVDTLVTLASTIPLVRASQTAEAGLVS
jgi:hypothetical protein